MNVDYMKINDLARMYQRFPEKAVNGGAKKKPAGTRAILFEIRGEEEDRTPDLRIANAALSQLSYPPDEFLLCHGLTLNFPLRHSRYPCSCCQSVITQRSRPSSNR